MTTRPSFTWSSDSCSHSSVASKKACIRTRLRSMALSTAWSRASKFICRMAAMASLQRRTQVFNRRQWLFSTGMLFGASRLSGAAQNPDQAGGGSESKSGKSAPLPLTEYEPKSMLHVHETHVAKCQFPCIDIHTHISFSKKAENGVQLAPEREYLGT